MKYLVEFKERLNNNDYRLVRCFYQPIIGAFASSLWQTMADNCSTNKFKVNYFHVDNLQKQLGMDFNTFTESRMKLEALGLIRTYEKLDKDIFLFTIIKPLNPSAFLNNKLLTVRLKRAIGEQQFESLIFTNKSPTLSKAEFLDVTAKYHDLFDLEREANKMVTTREIIIPKFENIDDAIINLSTEHFFKVISSEYPSPSQVLQIDNFRNIGFSNESLNLIINYCFEVNGKIITKYFATIAQNLFDGDVTTTQEVKVELTKALHSKKESIKADSTIEKISNGGEVSLEDIFKDLSTL